jgi:hypothetical protein
VFERLSETIYWGLSLNICIFVFVLCCCKRILETEAFVKERLLIYLIHSSGDWNPRISSCIWKNLFDDCVMKSGKTEHQIIAICRREKM